MARSHWGYYVRNVARPAWLARPDNRIDVLVSNPPWLERCLLDRDDERIDLYPGLANWWHGAEALWNQNRSSDRLDLIDRLDYRRGFSQQFPASTYRVVYGSSGMYLAAAIISDPSAVIDHKLYWAPANGLDEARFLTAVLNSTPLTLAVRPFQSHGEHNPRDFHKYVFQVPIPLYQPDDTSHRWLVLHAEHAEQVASKVSLPAMRFEAQRRQIREALVNEGVANDIDAIVKDLIA